MKIKSVKNNEGNKYPTENEIANDDERLKKPLRRWVKLGIGVVALLTILTVGVYVYTQSTMISGNMIVSTPNSQIEGFAGNKVSGKDVISLIGNANTLSNTSNSFPIPLIFYYKEEYYSSTLELQELSGKILEDKYYDVRMEDEKPQEKDGSFDTIYIEDYVEPVPNHEIN